LHFVWPSLKVRAVQALFANLFAAAGNRTAELSDAELATRYPVIGVGLAVLFLAGIVVDVYLLTRWAQARHDRVNLLGIHTAPWSLLEMAVATVAFFFLTIVLGIISVLFLAEHRAIALVAEMLFRAGLLVALVAYFRHRQTNWSRVLGLSVELPAPAIARGAFLYVGIFPALAVLVVLQERLCQAVGLKIKPQEIANFFITTDSLAVVSLLTLFAVVVAPLFEEILFRGLAYPVLKQRFGTARALAIVSGVFALIHFHLPSTVPLFALAVALALAYELTGSLLAAITMHALFNATSVAMLLYVRSHP
jgi:membrane protease YdiL (CAAX protease family)